MILAGQRCALRPWRSGDADVDAIVRHANNINVAKQLRDRFPHPYTRRDAQAFIKAVTHAETLTSFAIESTEGAVGGIGFVPGTDVERYSAEVGYWLGEAVWGRGIATEALTLLTTYLFDEIGLLRLFALPLAENLASVRVLEKAGFRCEGTLRSSCVKYGQPRDQLMFARINERWTNLRMEDQALL
jgi:[ribosomal protein S5]-alanine N-acetyltransferase